jgi:TolA-binding protein
MIGAPRVLWRVALLASALGCIATSARAQQDPINRAFDLERRGSYAAAADLYRTVLATRPAEASALLGLERSLIPLNRLPEIIPQAQKAIAADPRSTAAYGVALRAWAAADQPDSVRGIVERWAAMQPNDEAPYREWGAAAISRRDRTSARKAYQLARERMGRPDALAAELAQLAALDQDYPTAAREWLQAVQQLPGYRGVAVSSLAQAPEGIRPEILKQIERDSSRASRRIEVDLRARWGDPLGAYKLLAGAMPPSPAQAIEALQQFLEQVRGQTSKEALQAKGMVLEALAGRLAAGQRPKLQLDAARAYAEGGDRASAHRMLAAVAGDPRNAPEISSGAAATLIGLLVDEGNVAEASKKMNEFRASLPVEDFQRVRRSLALGWVRQGQMDRALELLSSDSTIEGTALSGRILLYRGDIANAKKALQAAGPFAGTREEATSRASLLAVLQPIEEDSLPALGKAFYQLDQGDTAAAASGLTQIAGQLPPDGGGVELRLLAGQLLAAQGKTSEAERLFRAAIVPESPATAAAATLELGRLLLTLGRRDEATHLLEGLILDYPQSAIVPQARRLLDQTRGAVPQT